MPTAETKQMVYYVVLPLARLPLSRAYLPNGFSLGTWKGALNAVFLNHFALCLFNRLGCHGGTHHFLFVSVRELMHPGVEPPQNTIPEPEFLCCSSGWPPSPIKACSLGPNLFPQPERKLLPRV